ncbi:MAG: hypothetical protein ACFFCS_24470 [Candidatus Hodarchaeota archaeon]
MMVDWEKINLKPEKDVKVTGTMLLEFKKKSEEQQDQISSLNTEIEKLNVGKKNLEERLNYANDRIKDLEKKADELVDVKEAKSALSKEHELLKERLQDADAKNTAQQEKIRDLENNSKKLEDTIVEKEKTISTLNGEIGGLKIALEKTGDQKDKELKEIFDEKEQMRSKFESEVHEQSEKTRDLETEIAKMNDQLTAEKATVSQKESKIKELDDKIASLKDDIADLKKQVDMRDDLIAERDFDYFKKLRQEQASKIDE